MDIEALEVTLKDQRNHIQVCLLLVLLAHHLFSA